MTSKEILSADVLDILFENRNKLYGAYTLRKNYNNRLGIALGISLGFIFLLIILFMPGAVSNEKSAVEGNYVVKPIAIPEEKIIIPELPVRKMPTEEQVSESEFLSRIKIVDNKKRVREFTDQRDLAISNISNRTLEGVAPRGIQSPGRITAFNGKTGNADSSAYKKPLVQKEPEFPGGMKAWLAFLYRHLSTPSPLDPGQKVTVIIHFMVAVDGEVTGFRVLKSGGESFDTEVIRVLKKMPKWNPAIVDGIPASRTYSQPVTFVGVEE